MSSGPQLVACLLLAAMAAQAQQPSGPSGEEGVVSPRAVAPAPSFLEIASNLPFRSYDRAALELLPRPRARTVVYQHRWERIHPFHVAAICNLRKRFLRGITGYRDWYSRTKVFPFASLNRGRFYLGIETREVLLVEADSRYAVLARQTPGPAFFPFQHSERRIAFTLRWNLD